MGRNERNSKVKAPPADNAWIEETYTKTHPVLGAVRRHLVDKIAGDNEVRDHTYLHPSEMCKPDWCPRASWYRITGEIPDDQEVGYRLANVFLEGHEIHDKWQTWFWEMGWLEGMWWCRWCDHRWWATAPNECPSCHHPRWAIKYAEVPIALLDLYAWGNADGILNIDGVRVLIEIKSIGLRSIELERPSMYAEYREHKDLNRLWQSIKMPFPVHVRQGTLYCRGADIDEIIYIYEFKANQDVKMFTIKYRESVLRHIIPGAMAVAKALENVHYTVQRPSWATEEHKTCKACPFNKPCWAEDDEE